MTLLILESHPVQYHAPVYRELARLRPGKIHVAYATDCSVRGHHDPGFGRAVAWDVPLLDGYPHTILHAERGEPLRGPLSLSGSGVRRLLRERRPRAVLLTQLAYEFEWVAYALCGWRGIERWLRTETQDAAFTRGRLRSLLRSAIYRMLYARLTRCFPIGELNRRHYLAHGVPEARMTFSRYCVPDALAGVPFGEKQARREALRHRLGLSERDCVVAFVGKLIRKKDPGLLLESWRQLAPAARARARLLFVGDGELRPTLEVSARNAGCPAAFAGFVNQRELPDFYLAADVVALPSRRAGETWGLVVNEALLAGCGVVISDAVGCGPEFGALPRVRIVPAGDGAALARALQELTVLPRDFDWARPAMEPYSVEAAATALAAAVDTLAT